MVSNFSQNSSRRANRKAPSPLPATTFHFQAVRHCVGCAGKTQINRIISRIGKLSAFTIACRSGSFCVGMEAKEALHCTDLCESCTCVRVPFRPSCYYCCCVLWSILIFTSVVEDAWKFIRGHLSHISNVCFIPTKRGKCILSRARV